MVFVIRWGVHAHDIDMLCSGLREDTVKVGIYNGKFYFSFSSSLVACLGCVNVYLAKSSLVAVFVYIKTDFHIAWSSHAFVGI